MVKHVLTSVAISLITFTGGQAEAQNADFSGTWTLDRDASQFPQGPGGGGRGGFGGGGGRRGGGGGGGARGGVGGGGPASVTIVQTNGELVMDRVPGGESQTVTYRLDGSESENAGPRGGMATTMSSWEGATLVTTGSQTLSTPRGEFTLETEERRKLSDAGQAMTVASTRTTPRGEIAAILVYRRANP